MNICLKHRWLDQLGKTACPECQLIEYLNEETDTYYQIDCECKDCLALHGEEE